MTRRAEAPGRGWAGAGLLAADTHRPRSRGSGVRDQKSAVLDLGAQAYCAVLSRCRCDPLLQLHDLEARLAPIVALYRTLLGLLFARFHREPPFEIWSAIQWEHRLPARRPSAGVMP